MAQAKIGLSNAQYAQIDDTDFALGEITKLPGLQEGKLDVSTDNSIVYADDGPYLVLSSGITELKLTLGVVDIGSTDKNKLLGVKYINGIEAYNKDLTAPDVAVMFKTKLSNGKSIYFGVLKGKFGLPSYEGKTKEDKAEAQTDSIEGSFVSRGDEGWMYLIGREDNEGFDLAKFTAAVFPKTDSDLDVIRKEATVIADPESVAVTADVDGDIAVEGTKQLTATVLPSTATQTVTWSSSAEATATVSATGKVTGVTAGTATITAKTANNKTATLEIAVTA